MPEGRVGLLELEIRHMFRSITQLHDELTTRASPCLVGFPLVDVGVGRGVVRKAAAGRRNRLFDCGRGRVMVISLIKVG